MTLHPGELEIRKVCLERDGLETSATDGDTYLLSEFVPVSIEQLAQHPVGPFGTPNFAGYHANPKGRARSSEKPALPIDDVSSRRLKTEGPNRISL